MKKNNILLYLNCILILVFSLLLKYSNYFILGWIAITLIMLFKYRFPKDNNYLKSNVIRIVIISIFTYFLLSYGLGIITGFGKNILSLKPINIIKNISIPLIMIICKEIIRYLYAKNSFSNIKPYIYYTITLMLSIILPEILKIDFTSSEAIFRFTCIVLFPTIAKELLYSYITYKVSYVPTLIMRLILELYLYIIPIFPNLGPYLISVFGILYPFIVYTLVNKVIKYYDKSKDYISLVSRHYLIYPLIIISVIVILLISGVCGYKIIAIGSGSMYPTYTRGDVVIYKNNNYEKDIEIGTIIAYEKNNVLITHRIVDIRKVNNNKVYITKGDNNDDVDEYIVLSTDIKGIVVYKISNLGYPTIWINEQFNNL